MRSFRPWSTMSGVIALMKDRGLPPDGLLGSREESIKPSNISILSESVRAAPA